MTETISQTQLDFLGRYVGYVPLTQDGGDPAGASGLNLMKDWHAAKDTVDTQLRTLSGRLRQSPTPEVNSVADQVETLLSPLRVKLVAALFEYQKAPSDTRARDAALGAIADAQAWLTSDGRVQAIDANPWGVSVSIVDTVGTALRKLHGDVNATQGTTS